MIESNYGPTYMKINYISTISKGQCSVIYYIANTITLYFIVHRFHVLCLFSTCPLTSPVCGLRCIVFNNVMFFSKTSTISSYFSHKIERQYK